MGEQFRPQFPIYIISKGRWESRLTAKALEKMGQPFFIVVESQEYQQYAAVIDPKKILVLDPKYQAEYNTCEIGTVSAAKGSGPARNFCWDHAIAAGYSHHWLMDDNIRCFYRYHAGQQLIVNHAGIFRAMEDFVLRYTNIGLAGPYYWLLTPRKEKKAVFTINNRAFSCMLIRNNLPFRWRARYNEDADLSIRVLKAGYCTIQFNAFLQGKVTTQVMKGGNTDVLYANGTREKSEMLARLHPDCVKVVERFHRIHHTISYKQFKQVPILKKDAQELQGEYGIVLKQIAPIRSPELQRWVKNHGGKK